MCGDGVRFRDILGKVNRFISQFYFIYFYPAIIPISIISSLSLFQLMTSIVLLINITLFTDELAGPLSVPILKRRTPATNYGLTGSI